MAFAGRWKASWCQTAGVVTAWIVAPTPTPVTCHIVTSAGRDDERTIYLNVMAR